MFFSEYLLKNNYKLFLLKNLPNSQADLICIFKKLENDKLDKNDVFLSNSLR